MMLLVWLAACETTLPTPAPVVPEPAGEEKEKERIRLAAPSFAPPTFEVLTDAEQGDPPPPTVPKNVPVVRLRSRVAESQEQGQLIVASGLKVDSKIVVVRCSCQYSRRNIFETKFVQIASSLR